jgi:hypothetical protein
MAPGTVAVGEMAYLWEQRVGNNSYCGCGADTGREADSGAPFVPRAGVWMRRGLKLKSCVLFLPAFGLRQEIPKL